MSKRMVFIITFLLYWDGYDINTFYGHRQKV